MKPWVLSETGCRRDSKRRRRRKINGLSVCRATSYSVCVKTRETFAQLHTRRVERFWSQESGDDGQPYPSNKPPVSNWQVRNGTFGCGVAFVLYQMRTIWEAVIGADRETQQTRSCYYLVTTYGLLYLKGEHFRRLTLLNVTVHVRLVKWNIALVRQYPGNGERQGCILRISDLTRFVLGEVAPTLLTNGRRSGMIGPQQLCRQTTHTSKPRRTCRCFDKYIYSFTTSVTGKNRRSTKG